MSTDAAVATPPDRRGRVARRRERMRSALAAAGLSRFLAFGVGAVSVEQLLADADVSRATFYQLFDNKISVLEYILKSVYEELIEGVAALEAQADADVVDGLIDVWARAHAAHGDAVRLLARLGPPELGPTLGAQHERLQAATLAAFGRAERADVLLNGSARYSARLVAEVVAPLLDVYGRHPAGGALFRDALRSLLVGPPAGGGAGRIVK